MKTPSLLRLPGLSIACALAALFAAPAQAAGPKAFQFTADGTNTSGDTMTIDHPTFNGKWKLKPVITQYWTGTYNPHPVGVSYNATTNRWQIENEDGAAVPAGANFNVLLAPGAKQTLCTPANTFSNVNFFQLQKNRPAGLFHITHMVNPVKNIPGTNFTGYAGTWFIEPFTPATPYSGRWTVFTENGDPFGTLAFNIADVTKLKVAKQPASFVFTTDAGNVGGHIATITNPLTDAKPDAVVFATHLYNNDSPTYVDKPLGVWYDGANWTIFAQDFSAMPLDAAFVVTVIPAATP